MIYLMEFLYRDANRIGDRQHTGLTECQARSEQKIQLDYYPLVETTRELTEWYAQVNAYSQGKIKGRPLPRGLSARNMGKNDLWIAATAF